MIRHPVFYTILLQAALLFSGCESRENLLSRLNFSAYRAISAADSAVIVRQLDDYYLSLRPAEPALDLVETRMADIISADSLADLQQNVPVIIKEPNPYLRENLFRDLLRRFISRRAARGVEPAEVNPELLRTIAEGIDSATGNNYWGRQITSILSWKKKQCLAWLKAEAARQLCKEKIENDPLLVEPIGAVGIQGLKTAPDSRVELEIRQRLFSQYYLVETYFHLAALIAEHAAKTARKQGHHLRYLGILYQQTECYGKSGHTIKKVAGLQKIRQYVKQIATDSIPHIGYYEISAIHANADFLRESGQYERALALADSIETMDYLTSKSADHELRVRNHFLRGHIALERGEFEKALDLFVRLPESATNTNKFLAKRNLSVIYRHMGHYDKAALALAQGREIQKRHLAGETDWSNLLRVDSLSIKMLDNNGISSPQDKQIIKKCLDKLKSESLQAETYSHLGSFSKIPDEALVYFRQALEIYERLKYRTAQIDQMLNMAYSYLALKEHTSAFEILHQAKTLAAQSSNKRLLISASGLLARTADAAGNIEDAVLYSENLLQVTEQMSNQLSNLKNLITYRSIIYPFLRDAVLYELKLGNAEAARRKLDRIRKVNQVIDLKSSSAASGTSHKNTAKDSSILSLHLNYFVLQNRLYILSELGDQAHISEVEISRRELRKHITAYLRHIKSTDKLLQMLNQMHQDSLIAARRHSKDYNAASIDQGEKIAKWLIGDEQIQRMIRAADEIKLFATDSLSSLPFECLPMPGEKGSYLLHHAGIINLPPLIELPAPPEIAKAEGQPHLLLAADFNGFASFIEGLEPALQASGYILDTMQCSNGASKNEILQEFQGNYDVCLLIGHGQVVQDNPDSSWIQLSSGVQPGSRLAKLTAADLSRVDWRGTQTVILLGCVTGDGPEQAGAGLVNLAQAPLRGGAREVIAGAWLLEADTYFEIVKKLLVERQLCGSTGLSLKRAQLATIEEQRTDETKFLVAHPFYWSGLRLFMINSGKRGN